MGAKSTCHEYEIQATVTGVQGTASFEDKTGGQIEGPSALVTGHMVSIGLFMQLRLRFCERARGAERRTRHGASAPALAQSSAVTRRSLHEGALAPAAPAQTGQRKPLEGHSPPTQDTCASWWPFWWQVAIRGGRMVGGVYVSVECMCACVWGGGHTRRRWRPSLHSAAADRAHPLVQSRSPAAAPPQATTSANGAAATLL